MKVFRAHKGQVIPLDRAHVDTDQIIPKQFLTSVFRTGYGDNLFDSWRYLDEGAPVLERHQRPNRRINPDFVLNEPRFAGASVLLARHNFGCGSSREHAVWALVEYGFRVVLAPSFADIFYANACKNGLLPVVLPEEEIERLFELALGAEPLQLEVNLESCQVRVVGGKTSSFEINEVFRNLLLNGLDEVGMTLAMSDSIKAYERKAAARTPWLFASSRPA